MPNRGRSLSLLVVALLAVGACQSSGVAPSPSDQPSASESGATRSASPSPTTPVASPSTSPTGAIEHPTEPEAIVLRMEQVGGLMPVELNAARLPAFTLYGDGTVIYQGDAPALQPGAAAEPLRVARLNEEQMQALLAFALGRGGLLDARPHYPNPFVTDAPSTVFTINAGGVDKEVTIDALEEGEPTTAEDVADRRAFAQLARALGTFGAAVRSGEASDSGAYEPAAYQGVLIESPGMQGEMRDWPWPDVSPEDFTQAEQFGFRTATLTPEQAAAVVDDPRGGVVAVPVTGPDRAPYTISIRPLLPEELE